MDALLRQEKRVRISENNAIPEFKQALYFADNIEAVQDAVKQMSGIVENQIRHSLGNANYERVIEMLRVMQGELVEYEAPKLFNDMLRQIKEELLKGELGGDRDELWYVVRKNNLGLIDNGMSERSGVSEEEAKKVSLRRVMGVGSTS